MEAIEYYAAIEGDGEEKHMYFQEKLRRLLSNQAVHDQVQKEAPKVQPKPQQGDQKRPEGSSSHRFNHKKQMELNLIMGERKAQDMTRDMMNALNVSHYKINNLVKNNLNTQEAEIAKRLEKRKQARSQSQSKLMLKSPALSVNTDEAVTVKLPMTPRAPTSDDDPYGLRAEKEAQDCISPDKEDGTGALGTKSQPVSKGKANFFNRLKRSAKPNDKGTTSSKQEVTIQVTAFESEDKQEAQEFADSNMKVGGTSQAGLSVDPMDSPLLEKPKKASTKKSKFKLAVTTEDAGSPAPMKSPRKIKVEVNVEEELAALKEELEVFQIQLEGEEDEAAKADWIAEIERVTEAIAAKEEEVAHQKNNPESKEVTDPSESTEVKLQVQTESSEIQGQTSLTEPSTQNTLIDGDLNENQEVVDKVTDDLSPGKDRDMDKKSSAPEEEDKSPSKPKKKSRK